MTTVLDILDKGTSYLEKRGIDDARRNMQLLVADQLDCTRIELYLRFDEPLEEAALAPLREALKKRGDGVPLQHLTGRVGFGSHEFKCDARALIPRPETEELAEWLAKHLELADRPAILDMGTGSGCLGLSLAADFPNATVTLADVSADALALARANAATGGFGDIEFLESDLFASIPADRTFDLIVANLPYVSEGEELAPEVRHDPALALFGGKDGLDVIRRFLPEAAGRLKSGAWLALEIGHDQSAEVERLLKESGLTDVRTLDDLSGVPRFPIARKG